MSGVYTQGRGPGERETTMRDLVAVIFRRKWLILSIFLVTTVSVGLKTLREPVTFSAETTLLLNRNEMRTSQLERRGSNLPWVEVVESEVEVLRSVPVLAGACERLAQPSGDFPEGLKIGHRQLQGRVRSGVVGESNVIYVSASASHPREAVAIANAVAESYLEHHRKLFAPPDASTMIRVRADSTFHVFESLQQSRATLLTGFGHTDVDEEERELVRLRLRLWSSVAQNEIDVRNLETVIAAGRAYLQGDLSGTTLPFEENTGSLHAWDTAQSLDQLRRAKQNLGEAKSKYTDRHPLVVEYANQVAELTENVRGAVERILGVKEHELRIKRGELDELRSQVREIDDRLQSLPDLRNQLGVLDSRLAAVKDHYEQLSEQATAAEINQMGFTDYGVTILSPAENARRNQKGDLVRLALGPLLALMAGIGLAFYLENLDHSLQNREDIERHLEIPVLASFPEVDMDEAAVQERGKQLPYQKGRARAR